MDISSQTDAAQQIKDYQQCANTKKKKKNSVYDPTQERIM